MAGDQQPLKSVHHLLFCSLLVLHFSAKGIHGLNIGVEPSDSSGGQRCSKRCESEFCTVPPFLRYGKYCGLLYSGCPGEQPCDELDACCMKHDDCIGIRNNNYLSQTCSEELINCVNQAKYSRTLTFVGNKCSVEEVADVITVTIQTALLAGRFLNDP
ncbi:PREDICTED: phospholipase A2-alpha-like isoform X2 [Nelumbo nucifera]|uniref:phospholipase A2 n=1 Tax=Nelumbo nucifera TaxID=4432 RepID=A0A1U8AKV7_NELNU|nr:PREDICTED: phospholipase A2-alpha-like isoform X2 [Nelumbo nucifera]